MKIEESTVTWTPKEYYQSELEDYQRRLAKAQVNLIDLETSAMTGTNNKVKRKYAAKAVEALKYKVTQLEQLIAAEGVNNAS